MAERLILDPTEVTINREEWDITQYVAESGPDWGDATVEQSLADTEHGSLPVDYRTPSRTVTIPLLLQDSLEIDGLTFDEVRERFQHKAATFQQDGGAIARFNTSRGTVFADVTGATLKLGGSTAQALWGVDADAILTLTTLADWYGDEEQGSVITATGEVVALVGPIKGNYPGRARIKITENSNREQHGAIFAFRAKTYSAAPTAQMVYEAEAMTPIAPASATTVASVAVIGRTDLKYNLTNDVPAPWQGIMSTDLLSGGPLTHFGTYRVWAEVRVTAPCQIRFAWDVGDFTQPTYNPPQNLFFAPLEASGTNPGLRLVDLGQVMLGKMPVGTHRWRGEIQSRGVRRYNAAGNTGDTIRPDIYVDKFYVLPVDESYGVLRSPVDAAPELSVAVIDEPLLYTGTTGDPLTGKSVNDGQSGVWSAAGHATPFAIDVSAGNVTRAATTAGNHHAIAGTRVFTAVDAQVDVLIATLASATPAGEGGLFTRYVDTSNYISLALKGLTAAANDPGSGALVFVTGMSAAWFMPLSLVANVWYTLRLIVDTAGRFFGWVVPKTQGGLGAPLFVGNSSVLATGGACASGKVGLYDASGGATAITKRFDNFIVGVPTPDVVLNANREGEARFDGHYRQSSDGIGYGPVPQTLGDLARVPVSGMEDRAVEMFVKLSRGDLSPAMVDLSRAGSLKAQLLYRPAYLFLP
jgi:hypothetical protein